MKHFYIFLPFFLFLFRLPPTRPFTPCLALPFRRAACAVLYHFHFLRHIRSAGGCVATLRSVCFLLFFTIGQDCRCPTTPVCLVSSALPCPFQSSKASASPVSASSLSLAAVSDLRWEHAPAAGRSCVSSSWLPCLDFTANECQLPPFLPCHLLWEFFRVRPLSRFAYQGGPQSLGRSLHTMSLVAAQ